MAFISEKAVGGTEGVETIEPGQRRLNFLQRMYHFYNAPVVKFFIYIVSLIHIFFPQKISEFSSVFVGVKCTLRCGLPPTVEFKSPNFPLTSQLMYFAFLASFAYALLVKQPRKSRASGTMDNAELVVYVWTVSIIPVEIRQVLFDFFVASSLMASFSFLEAL